MSDNNGGFSILIVCPASGRLKALAPFFRKPRTREPAAIRLPTGNPATICLMTVRAFAAPRERTVWKRQSGRLVAQEAFITQPPGSGARPRPSDNADGVPRLFDGSGRSGLCHALTLHHWYRRGNQRPADSLVGRGRTRIDSNG